MDDKLEEEERARPAPPAGMFFLIGGAAEGTLKDFVALAGGREAVIAILPHASGAPAEAAEKLTGTLLDLGAGTCYTVMPPVEGKTGTTGLSANTTAVYMTGGDQSTLVKLLSADLLAQVQAMHQRGGIIAGTSAGAAAVSLNMIAGGMTDGLLRCDSLQMAPGLGLLPDCIVDTHVGERGRTERLMAAVFLNSQSIGIGLDEDTACLISEGGHVSVYGKGHARFYRASSRLTSNLCVDQGTGKRASVDGMLISVLSAGGEYLL